MDKISWSGLWKKEDWLTVWAGAILILVVLTGVSWKLPVLKWNTDKQLESYLDGYRSRLEKLSTRSIEKGESDVFHAATELTVAIDSKDRYVIQNSANHLEEATREVVDKEIYTTALHYAKDIRTETRSTFSALFTTDNILNLLILLIALLALSFIAFRLSGEKSFHILIAFPVVFLLSTLSLIIAGNYSIQYYGLEYVIWGLAIGLIISNLLGIPEWMKPAIRTEFYIKTGVVILGAGILFNEIAQAGIYGIIQALFVVSVVWYACFWIARRLKVDDEFAAILSSAVSICGISAAIATAGAIKGDPKKLSYTTSLVLIVAVPMLILQPIIAKLVGMPDMVAGAWLGGTLDTTGSVAAAGALISEPAMKTGIIVKMSQNVLIGVAAFILSIVWAMKTPSGSDGVPVQRLNAMEIWYRFPKFVIGFIVISLLFSFVVSTPVVESTKPLLTGLRTWWFALAFVSIGLETNFKDMATMGGGRPAVAFLAAQVINIFWTLLLAYLIFGGHLFPIPLIK